MKPEDILGEVWKQVDSTPYFVSNYGRVKRIYKCNKQRLLIPYKKTQKKGSYYMLIKIHGKAYKMSKLVWECFKGEIPKGYVLVHKDRVPGNNDLSNLLILSKKENGQRTGGRNSRRRLIYDMKTGRVYKGTREAAKALFISRQTVSDYCNNKIQKPTVHIRWMSEHE